jgi:2-oxoglutarate ferredoxin oxidoreductase subunit delta
MDMDEKLSASGGQVEVIINRELCNGCGLCVDVCPRGLISISGVEINRRGYPFAQFDDPEGKCTSCTQCAIICPDVVIEIRKVEK